MWGVLYPHQYLSPSAFFQVVFRRPQALLKILSQQNRWFNSMTRGYSTAQALWWCLYCTILAVLEASKAKSDNAWGTYVLEIARVFHRFVLCLLAPNSNFCHSEGPKSQWYYSFNLKFHDYGCNGPVLLFVDLWYHLVKEDPCHPDHQHLVNEG